MKEDLQIRRKSRVRAKISGTADRPRASVFRSNSSMYIQFVDDEASKTLLSFDLRKIKGKSKSRVEAAEQMGKEVAKIATKNKISKIVFDRSGYKYHGRVKALADGMRDGGLSF
jgi:large subunit ribosomal protein L18